MKQSLTTRVLNALWYDRLSWAAPLLLPFSWLYRLALSLHRSGYRKGVFRVRELPVPVIVVGNLVAGGGGKTPLTLWLTQRLAAAGLRPGIASRGYGRRSRETLLAGADTTAEEVGDEPLLLAQRSRVPVAVAEKRADACALLCSDTDVNVIVCDDGLQHWALARDVEICVVSGSRGLGNGYLLPAGPLRELPSRLHTVDFVVIQGEGFEFPEAYRANRHLNSPMALGSAEKRPWPLWRGQSIAAVAGVADPGAFFGALEALGLKVDRYPLDDHAPIDESWLESLDKPVLLTEKDAARLRSDALDDVWVVPLEVELEHEAQFIQNLLKRVRNGGGMSCPC